jgi:hypothetical protein
MRLVAEMSAGLEQATHSEFRKRHLVFSPVRPRRKRLDKPKDRPPERRLEADAAETFACGMRGCIGQVAAWGKCGVGELSAQAPVRTRAESREATQKWLFRWIVA